MECHNFTLVILQTKVLGKYEFRGPGGSLHTDMEGSADVLICVQEDETKRFVTVCIVLLLFASAAKLETW